MGQICKEKIFIFCVIFILPVCFIVSPAMATGTETLITTNNNDFNHQFPKIFNDQIVWQDLDPSGSFGIIYVYNITSGIETQVTDNTTYANHPAIFGNLITYTDWGGCSSFCSSSLIYLYDLATGIRIPISSGTDTNDNSAIYNNRIVWQNMSSISGISQIYINGTSPALATPVNASGNNQAYPAIFNNLVAYMDCGGDSTCSSPSAIYLYNISSSIGTQISSGSSWNAYPAIYNNRIPWLEEDAYGNPSQILINESVMGSEDNLTPNDQNLTTFPSTHPAISGNWVVWFQTNATTGNSDIYVNDTSTHQTIPIALDRYGVELTSIWYSTTQSLYRIVWDEQPPSGGMYNVYLYTSGPTQTCPVASFTNDFIGGSAPVTVHFTDTSSLNTSITHWYWDFGDGSNSTQEFPAYTYTTNGPYAVSLTVSDPYCRNTTTVTNSVVVGQPIANFTASPTTSVVPATIAFTDTSLGSPSTWNWSWGDGLWTNGSTENPTHEYTSAGLYLGHPDRKQHGRFGIVYEVELHPDPERRQCFHQHEHHRSHFRGYGK